MNPIRRFRSQAQRTAEPSAQPAARAADAAANGGEGAQSDVESARFLAETYHHLQHELAKVIVGQERVIEELLVAVFARGHCIMQGVPGLAKTLLVSTLAQ